MLRILYNQHDGASGADSYGAPVQKAYSYNTGATGAVAPVYNAECTGAAVQKYLGKLHRLHRLLQVFSLKRCKELIGAKKSGCTDLHRLDLSGLGSKFI